MKKAKKLDKYDKYELRLSFESVLKKGTREDTEPLRRALDKCEWNIMLRENRFTVKQDGAVTTVIPPKRPNRTALEMIKTMKEHGDNIFRRFFGPLPTSKAPNPS